MRAKQFHALSHQENRSSKLSSIASGIPDFGAKTGIAAVFTTPDEENLPVAKC
jgi:hypothetical protein